MKRTFLPFTAASFLFLCLCAASSLLWDKMLAGATASNAPAWTLAVVILGMALSASGAWVVETTGRMARK